MLVQHKKKYYDELTYACWYSTSITLKCHRNKVKPDRSDGDESWTRADGERTRLFKVFRSDGAAKPRRNRFYLLFTSNTLKYVPRILSRQNYITCDVNVIRKAYV